MPTHYQRTLPHLLPPGEIVFITYRLAGSIPTDVILRLIEELQAALRRVEAVHSDEASLLKAKHIENKRHFAAFDNYLDTGSTGPAWLSMPSVAEIVKEGIHHKAGIDYDLHAYCIMSNHVHILLSIREGCRPFHHDLEIAERILGSSGQ